MNDLDFKIKYIKYKLKYLQLKQKEQSGGMQEGDGKTDFDSFDRIFKSLVGGQVLAGERVPYGCILPFRKHSAEQTPNEKQKRSRVFPIEAIYSLNRNGISVLFDYVIKSESDDNMSRVDVEKQYFMYWLADINHDRKSRNWKVKDGGIEINGKKIDMGDVIESYLGESKNEDGVQPNTIAIMAQEFYDQKIDLLSDSENSIRYLLGREYSYQGSSDKYVLSVTPIYKNTEYDYCGAIDQGCEKGTLKYTPEGKFIWGREWILDGLKIYPDCFKNLLFMGKHMGTKLINYMRSFGVDQPLQVKFDEFNDSSENYSVKLHNLLNERNMKTTLNNHLRSLYSTIATLYFNDKIEMLSSPECRFLRNLKIKLNDDNHWYAYFTVHFTDHIYYFKIELTNKGSTTNTYRFHVEGHVHSYKIIDKAVFNINPDDQEYEDFLEIPEKNWHFDNTNPDDNESYIGNTDEHPAGMLNFMLYIYTFLSLTSKSFGDASYRLFMNAISLLDSISDVHDDDNIVMSHDRQSARQFGDSILLPSQILVPSQSGGASPSAAQKTSPLTGRSWTPSEHVQKIMAKEAAAAAPPGVAVKASPPSDSEEAVAHLRQLQLTTMSFIHASTSPKKVLSAILYSSFHTEPIETIDINSNTTLFKISVKKLENQGRLDIDQDLFYKQCIMFHCFNLSILLNNSLNRNRLKEALKNFLNNPDNRLRYFCTSIIQKTIREVILGDPDFISPIIKTFLATYSEQMAHLRYIYAHLRPDRGDKQFIEEFEICFRESIFYKFIDISSFFKELKTTDEVFPNLTLYGSETEIFIDKTRKLYTKLFVEDIVDYDKYDMVMTNVTKEQVKPFANPGQKNIFVSNLLRGIININVKKKLDIQTIALAEIHNKQQLDTNYELDLDLKIAFINSSPDHAFVGKMRTNYSNNDTDIIECYNLICLIRIFCLYIYKQNAKRYPHIIDAIRVYLVFNNIGDGEGKLLFENNDNNDNIYRTRLQNKLDVTLNSSLYIDLYRMQLFLDFAEFNGGKLIKSFLNGIDMSLFIDKLNYHYHKHSAILGTPSKDYNYYDLESDEDSQEEESDNTSITFNSLQKELQENIRIKLENITPAEYIKLLEEISEHPEDDPQVSIIKQIIIEHTHPKLLVAALIDMEGEATILLDHFSILLGQALLGMTQDEIDKVMKHNYLNIDAIREAIKKAINKEQKAAAAAAKIAEDALTAAEEDKAQKQAALAELEEAQKLAAAAKIAAQKAEAAEAEEKKITELAAAAAKAAAATKIAEDALKAALEQVEAAQAAATVEEVAVEAAKKAAAEAKAAEAAQKAPTVVAEPKLARNKILRILIDHGKDITFANKKVINSDTTYTVTFNIGTLTINHNIGPAVHNIIIFDGAPGRSGGRETIETYVYKQQNRNRHHIKVRIMANEGLPMIYLKPSWVVGTETFHGEEILEFSINAAMAERLEL